MKYFIAVYTNKVKEYCDKEFFKRIGEISGDNLVAIVDNSVGWDYYNTLKQIINDSGVSNSLLMHIEMEQEPDRTIFLRSVTESVERLRNGFLSGNFDKFLIIESDVIPPVDLLNKLDEDINEIEHKENVGEYAPMWRNRGWGIIGGIYYKGFHDFEQKGLHKTNHCLSGCTLYKRELLEKTPFRWSEDNLGAFPDAWMSGDAASKGYTLYNDYDIVCDHLSLPSGSRQLDR